MPVENDLDVDGVEGGVGDGYQDLVGFGFGNRNVLDRHVGERSDSGNTGSAHHISTLQRTTRARQLGTPGRP